MPNWAAGNRCWMACAITWAPVCQNACLPSLSSKVRMSSRQSFSSGVRRSASSPSMRALVAALYSPMPRLFATSAAETPASNSLTTPSFNVTLIMPISSCVNCCCPAVFVRFCGGPSLGTKQKGPIPSGMSPCDPRFHPHCAAGAAPLVSGITARAGGGSPPRSAAVSRPVSPCGFPPWPTPVGIGAAPCSLSGHSAAHVRVIALVAQILHPRKKLVNRPRKFLDNHPGRS